MIIFCEECGERYFIEDNEIKDTVIMFDCRICNEPIKVIVPDYKVKDPANNEITEN